MQITGINVATRIGLNAKYNIQKLRCRRQAEWCDAQWRVLISYDDSTVGHSAIR